MHINVKAVGVGRAGGRGAGSQQHASDRDRRNARNESSLPRASTPEVSLGLDKDSNFLCIFYADISPLGGKQR